MKKLVQLADAFLKLSADTPEDLIDDPKANRICNNFLLVKENHPRYSEIMESVKTLLSGNSGASDLLTMYILNSYEMPDITPSHNLEAKILLINDLLAEDDLVRILNDLRFKEVKPFMNHRSPKVRQVVFSRLGVRDKDSEILELENLRYSLGLGRDGTHRAHVLLRMLKENMVTAQDIPKLLKYFEDISAPHHEYLSLFKEYAKSLSKHEAAMLLEKTSLPDLWKHELQIVAEVPSSKKPATMEGVMEGLDKLNLMYGKKNDKLN